MSHYPLNSNFEYDINNDFWIETVVCKSDEEFDNWVENHPFGSNVVQVYDIKNK